MCQPDPLTSRYGFLLPLVEPCAFPSENLERGSSFKTLERWHLLHEDSSRQRWSLPFVNSYNILCTHKPKDICATVV